MERDTTQRTILIVDDDETLLVLATKHLEKRGYSVLTSATGLGGIKLAREKIPDLIVLDIVIPDIDGWTIMRRLRTVHELLFVPVIFISSMASPENRVKGFSLGADDFLTKPFNLKELSFRIDRSLRRQTEIEPAVRSQIDSSGSIGVPSLRGTIGEIGIVQILLLLERGNKTGSLRIWPVEEAKVAEVRFAGGRIERAAFVDEEFISDITDKEVIAKLVNWPAGRFEFTVGPETNITREGISPSALIWELVDTEETW